MCDGTHQKHNDAGENDFALVDFQKVQKLHVVVRIFDEVSTLVGQVKVMSGDLRIGDFHGFQNPRFQIRQTDSLGLPPLQAQLSYVNDVLVDSFEGIEFAHSDSPDKLLVENGIERVRLFVEHVVQNDTKSIDVVRIVINELLVLPIASDDLWIQHHF